jgi:hypothetical protein
MSVCGTLGGAEMFCNLLMMVLNMVNGEIQHFAQRYFAQQRMW